MSFVVLSDVWLDHPRTLVALKKMFEGYAESLEYRPMVFVLCGNFCQRGLEGEGGLKRYTSEDDSTVYESADELQTDSMPSRIYSSRCRSSTSRTLCSSLVR